MAVKRMPAFARVKCSLIVFSLALTSCGTTTESTESGALSRQAPSVGLSSTTVGEPPESTTTSTLLEPSAAPEVILPRPGYSEVRDRTVLVHVGMECPNLDLAFTTGDDWTFALEEVVPAILTLDSEIQRGSWSNSAGSSAVLLVPASSPVGETAHDFGLDSTEWEEVIVPAGPGWRFGVRPLVEGADEFSPRCNVGYLTEDLSLDDFIAFIESMTVEADM